LEADRSADHRCRSTSYHLHDTIRSDARTTQIGVMGDHSPQNYPFPHISLHNWSMGRLKEQASWTRTKSCQRLSRSSTAFVISHRRHRHTGPTSIACRGPCFFQCSAHLPRNSSPIPSCHQCAGTMKHLRIIPSSPSTSALTSAVYPAVLTTLGSYAARTCVEHIRRVL
jgi:hypothetical protein